MLGRPDAALVEEFAKTIAKTDMALLVDADNRNAGWMTIREAAASGRAFCVEVVEVVLAADGDDPRLSGAVMRLAEAMRFDGLQPLVVASGQSGHLHLFCRIEDADVCRRYIERAKEAGLDVRSGNNRIRPPLAPHRLGLPVRLLTPGDPAEALAALCCKRPVRGRSLSPRIEQVLRDGDHEAHGYRSRSHMIQGIALGFVNAERTSGELFAAILNPGNRAGDKLRDRSPREARRYIDRCWAKAVEKATKSPAIVDREGALKVIKDVRAAAALFPWKGVAGTTDQIVLGVHLRIAVETGKLSHHADVRTVAERAGCSASTASCSQSRLRDAGWLKLVARGRGPDANVWRLRLPRQGCTQSNTPTSAGRVPPATLSPPDRCPPPITPCPGGASGECPPRYTPASGECSEKYTPGVDPSHDAWRRGGLGKSTYRVWRVLTAVRPRRAKEIAAGLPLGLRMTQRHLGKLRQHGLAVQDGDGWRRGKGDLDRVAEALDVSGKGEAEQRRHERDRRTYRHALADGAQRARVASLA